MPPMSHLSLDPDNTLHFCKTSTTTSPSRVLKLTNVHAGCVAFKVKTTAPKGYLVRPSNGTLKPQESQEVQIILQMQTQSAESTANPDRFLVQAVAVKDSEPLGKDEWNKFSKDQLQEQKLNVVVEEEQEPDNKADKAATNAFVAVGDARSGGQSADGNTDIKVKYDELVNYTLTLEKEKKKLEHDLAAAVGAKGISSSAGVSTVTLFLAVLVAFLVPYAANFLG